MARRHMIQTWTSSFLQTSREFFRVLRLGSVLERVTRVELKENRTLSETITSAEIFLVYLYILLPDGMSSCAGGRWWWGREAAIAMKIFYRPTPGGVDGWDFSSGLGLLSVKPDQTNTNLNHIIQSVTVFSNKWIYVFLNLHVKQLKTFPTKLTQRICKTFFISERMGYLT